MNSKRYSVPVTICKQAAADSTREIGYSEATFISGQRFLAEQQAHEDEKWAIMARSGCFMSDHGGKKA